MNILLGMILVPYYYIGCFVAFFVYPLRVGGSPSAYVTAVAHPASRRNGIPWDSHLAFATKWTDRSA